MIRMGGNEDLNEDLSDSITQSLRDQAEAEVQGLVSLQKRDEVKACVMGKLPVVEEDEDDGDAECFSAIRVLLFRTRKNMNAIESLLVALESDDNDS